MKNMSGQFRDFIASKPADETFDYNDNCNCAFAQFLKEYGYCEGDPSVGSWGWNKPLVSEIGWEDIENPIPKDIAEALYEFHIKDGPGEMHSFGDLAKCLETV